MPVHLAEHLNQNHHIPRILVLRPKASFGNILDDLIFIAEVDENDEFCDRIVHIPLQG